MLWTAHHREPPNFHYGLGGMYTHPACKPAADFRLGIVAAHCSFYALYRDKYGHGADNLGHIIHKYMK